MKPIFLIAFLSMTLHTYCQINFKSIVIADKTNAQPIENVDCFKNEILVWTTSQQGQFIIEENESGKINFIHPDYLSNNPVEINTLNNGDTVFLQKQDIAASCDVDFCLEEVEVKNEYNQRKHFNRLSKKNRKEYFKAKKTITKYYKIESETNIPSLQEQEILKGVMEVKYKRNKKWPRIQYVKIDEYANNISIDSISPRKHMPFFIIDKILLKSLHITAGRKKDNFRTYSVNGIQIFSSNKTIGNRHSLISLGFNHDSLNYILAKSYSLDIKQKSSPLYNNIFYQYRYKDILAPSLIKMEKKKTYNDSINYYISINLEEIDFDMKDSNCSYSRKIEIINNFKTNN